MVCPNCRMQIPDTSAICPSCGYNLAGTPKPSPMPQPQAASTQRPPMPSGSQPMARPSQPQVMPGSMPGRPQQPAQMAGHNVHAMVHHEVKKRHWQRWFFYGLLIVVFGAMVAYASSIYLRNAALIESINDAQQQLQQAQANLSNKEAELSTVKQSAADTQRALESQMQDLQGALNQQSVLVSDLDRYKEIGASAENVFASLQKIAAPVTAENLSKIALADSNLAGVADNDSDGLSDLIEASLGTDPNKADTDGDGYSDKQEMLTGYDPLASGQKLPLDEKIGASLKGKVISQDDGYLWYVGFDGKKNFLGKAPASAQQDS